MYDTTYLDFDLLIERGQREEDAQKGLYRARVLNSPAGQALGTFQLPFGGPELVSFLGAMASGQLRQGRGMNPSRFGETLFATLFREQIGYCWARSLDAAQREGTGLRLRLRLTDAPELAQLPWEYLKDGSQQRVFVLSDQTPIVRYLEMASTERPLEVTRPLRILMMIANPRNHAPLDVEHEWEKVQQALHDLLSNGLVEIERLTNPTLDALQKRLRQSEYHVLHFIGHGVFNGQEGGLLFEDRKGLANLVPAPMLGTLLRDHRSLRLTLLNACEGARGAGDNAFAGTAQRLVQQGLPSVIAMQFPVSDQAAITISEQFYRALADGYPVDAALAEARKALFANGNPYEWGTPVLFMRAPDGHLFDIEGGGQEGPTPGEPPFKGLQYFEEQDAHRFFGRETLIAQLITRLRELMSTQQPRFLAVIGASGSGKSSVVRAGLLPALKGRKQLPDGTLLPLGSTEWPIHVITPTNHPLEALAASLAGHTESVSAMSALIDDLAHNPRALHLHVRKLLTQAQGMRWANSRPGHSSFSASTSEQMRFLLVVEQFEELFTMCHDTQERQAFVDNLMEAASTNGPTVVLITMRADFYAQCAQFEALRAILAKQQEFIGPMNEDALRRAIEEPAKQSGWGFERGLVDQLLKDVGSEPGALPLLSHALLETWKRRSGRTLTFAGYAQSGGVHGAIAHTAEQVFTQRLNEEQQEVAKFIFLRLTELGDKYTRRRASMSELMPIDQTERAEAVEVVLRILVDVRLVITTEETAEVAHEALIREWPTLGRWLEENSEGLRIHRQLNHAAQEWIELDHDSGALYRGARLAQALEWANLHSKELNTLERRFLSVAQEANEREEAEREAQRQRELEQARALAEAEHQRAEEQMRGRQRLRGLMSVLVVFFILAIGLAWYANNERIKAQESQQEAVQAQNEAEMERTRAEEKSRLATSRELAAVAEAEQEVHPQHSLLLAIQALRMNQPKNEVEGDYIPAAEQALRNVLTNMGGIGLSGHKDGIRALAISPDSHWLVTGSPDQTARLWNLQEPSRDPIVLKGHTDAIWTLAFSPNGRWLVTGSNDTNIRLWDLSQKDLTSMFEPIVLSGHEGWVMAAAFTPDTRWLITSSSDATVRLWNLTQPDFPPIVLRGHKDQVVALAISPDGRWLATASADQTARLWPIDSLSSPTNASSLAETSIETISPLVLAGHQAALTSVAFSPASDWLVTGSKDNTARLWPIAQAEKGAIESLELTGHDNQIRSVAFSPDARWLVTASGDTTARLWPLNLLSLAEPLPEPVVLDDHQAEIRSVAFSPDSRWLVTGSEDHTIRQWDMQNLSIEPMVLQGHDKEVRLVAYTPNQKWLVSASSDGTARLWPMPPQAAGPSRFIQANQDALTEMVISSDSHWLATRSISHSLRLWDIRSHLTMQQPILATTGQSLIDALAISPDSQSLLAASDDGLLRQWNLTDLSAAPMIYNEQIQPINLIRISPDNRWLVTGNQHGQFLLQSVPQGRSNLSASPESCANATNEQSCAASFLLERHSRLEQVAFTPDSHWLVSIGSHQASEGQQEKPVTYLWNLTAEDPSAQPIRLSGYERDILAVATSNRWLVMGGQDRKLFLWDLNASDPQPAIVEKYEQPIWAIAMSSDEQWLVIGTDDGNIRLRNLADPDPFAQEPISLVGHRFGISALAFSPNNQWLISTSRQNARLWNLSNQHTVTQPILFSTDTEIKQVAFTPDGNWLVTGHADGHVQFWSLNVGDLMQIACRAVGRNLSLHEWEQYFAQQPYQKSCPNLPGHHTVIDFLIGQAKALAKTGEIEQAQKKYNEAIALDRSLNLDPVAEIERIVELEQLLSEANMLARQGNIDSALSKLEEALHLDGNLDLNSEQEKQQIASLFAKRGLELLERGEMEDALNKLLHAQAIDANIPIQAQSWHQLCEFGKEEPHAATVLPACNKAIALEPQNAQYRQSRGIVRSLIKDYAGAKEDFEFYLKSAQ